MIGLALNTAALLFIMWMVAKNNAEFSFLTTVLVIVGINICGALLSLIHPLAGLLAYFIILPLALVRFCCLSIKQGLVVAGIYFIWLIAFHMAWEHVTTFPEN